MGGEGFDVDDGRSLCEVEVADQVDVAPGNRRDALEDSDGVEIAGRRLLLVNAGEEQGVVVDDGVGDQPGTLVSYLLLGFTLDAELA